MSGIKNDYLNLEEKHTLIVVLNTYLKIKISK